MAKPGLIKRLTNIATDAQSNIDKLYSDTHFTSNKNSKDLDSIRKDMDLLIDKITDGNIKNVGVPNISRFYARMGGGSEKDITKRLEETFNDNVLMDNVFSAYAQNKYLKDLDEEIDTVCKYVPKLLEALDTRKDNVLSADHFSKDFINVVNRSNIEKNELFSDRIQELKEIYDINNLIDTAYDNAAKYGEEFIYIVPYKKAISKLINNKANTFTANVKMESCSIICESGNMQMEDMKPFNVDMSDRLELQIQLNKTGILESAVMDMKMMRQKMGAIKEMAVNEQPLLEENNLKEKKEKPEKREKFNNKLIDDKLVFDDFTSQDGFVDANSTGSTKKDIDIPGCVVKKLERSSVIPIFIENICFGYYYFEFSETSRIFDFNNQMSDPMIGMKSNNKMDKNSNDDKRDNMVKYISAQLSKFIDTNFINNNQDLRKEIYMILKYNDIMNSPNSEKFKVTFIPPEDMVHIKFNTDPLTHRGISDLAKAMIPAKLYGSMYITNSIATMTRGQDKRVYYVKQTVDTNIAQTLLNVIDQVKKSNFGIRQIENMNHILNITGRFNDYVIPLGPSGDAPIQMEVMSGQNIDVKTDLMAILEEMAINSTDVPLELIQNRQSMDFAIHLTMTNSKFLRKVYNRQSKFQPFCSDIVTKLYNGEYNEHNKLQVTLPPPMFLNVANTNQMMNNTKDLVLSISEFMMLDEPDEDVKNLFQKELMMFHLGSFLDLDKYKDCLYRAKQQAALNKKEVMQQEG